MAAVVWKKENEIGISWVSVAMLNFSNKNNEHFLIGVCDIYCLQCCFYDVRAAAI